MKAKRRDTGSAFSKIMKSMRSPTKQDWMTREKKKLSKVQPRKRK